MVKKGKHFSGKVTPLFASMLVQSTEDEGATSERPYEPQPTPSPTHPSEANIEPQGDEGDEGGVEMMASVLVVRCWWCTVVWWRRLEADSGRDGDDNEGDVMVGCGGEAARGGGGAWRRVTRGIE
ncbi:hypothetical protein Tco_1228070 [Tanacetum coccineum]